MIDDDYERTTEGAADLKRDNFNHPRTSFESLKRLAGTLSATPTDTVKRKAIQANLRDPYKRAPNKAQHWPQASTYVREQLDDMRSWILTNSTDLPCELEDEQGRIKEGRTYFEQTDDTLEAGDLEWTGDELDVSKYEAHGRFHVLKQGYAEPLLSIAQRKPEHRADPTGYAGRAYAMRIRGARYQKHAEAQATRLRWRGMEEWDAVGKASEKLEEGLARTPSDSNAKPLPSIESLQAQFEAIDGVLYHKRLNRPVTGRKVKINGELYAPSRVAFAVMYGQDPGSLMVRDGRATKYRGAEGSVTPRADGNYDAQIAYDSNDRLTVGEYATKRQAEEACSIYLQTLERWG